MSYPWPDHEYFIKFSKFLDKKSFIHLPKVPKHYFCSTIKKGFDKGTLKMIYFYPTKFFFKNDPLYNENILQCEIKSSSLSTKYYTVKFIFKNFVQINCNCPSFMFCKEKNKTCKHIHYVYFSFLKQQNSITL